MILIMFAIQKSHNIKNAMRISAIFMVISTAGLLVYTLAKDDFELHIGVPLCTLPCCYLPTLSQVHSSSSVEQETSHTCFLSSCPMS